MPQEEIDLYMATHYRTYKEEVIKGKPRFTVDIHDSGGAHCCQDVTISGPGGDGMSYDPLMTGLDGRVSC